MMTLCWVSERRKVPATRFPGLLAQHSLLASQTGSHCAGPLGSKSEELVWRKCSGPKTGSGRNLLGRVTVRVGDVGDDPRAASLVHAPWRPKATPRVSNSSSHLSCSPLSHARLRDEQFLHTGLASSHLIFRARQALQPVRARL
jgi:hypothetical protein